MKVNNSKSTNKNVKIGCSTKISSRKITERNEVNDVKLGNNQWEVACGPAAATW